MKKSLQFILLWTKHCWFTTRNDHFSIIFILMRKIGASNAVLALFLTMLE
jgi:hypothetical protein